MVSAKEEADTSNLLDQTNRLGQSTQDSKQQDIHASELNSISIPLDCREDQVSDHNILPQSESTSHFPFVPNTTLKAATEAASATLWEEEAHLTSSSVPGTPLVSHISAAEQIARSKTRESYPSHSNMSQSRFGSDLHNINPQSNTLLNSPTPSSPQKMNIHDATGTIIQQFGVSSESLPTPRCDSRRDVLESCNERSDQVLFSSQVQHLRPAVQVQPSPRSPQMHLPSSPGIKGALQSSREHHPLQAPYLPQSPRMQHTKELHLNLQAGTQTPPQQERQKQPHPLQLLPQQQSQMHSRVPQIKVLSPPRLQLHPQMTSQMESLPQLHHHQLPHAQVPPRSHAQHQQLTHPNMQIELHHQTQVDEPERPDTLEIQALIPIIPRRDQEESLPKSAVLSPPLALGSELLARHGLPDLPGDSHSNNPHHSRNIAAGSHSKKSGRIPGTKQCPSCQNTIAAAVASCPKCSHVFREKKEKIKRSGKRGKKNCPKCKYENPSACSSCKNCNHVFRLKLMDKYKAMRPRQSNDTAVAAAAAAAHAAANIANEQHPAASAVSTVPMPAGVVAYPNQFSQAMHESNAPTVIPVSLSHSMNMHPHTRVVHNTDGPQVHSLPQHSMQPHTHPQ